MDELVVFETVVAVGLLANLALLIATTEFNVERGADGELEWSLTKRQASPELVKAVVEPVVEAAKKA